MGTNIRIYIKIIAGEGGITLCGFIKQFQLYSWSQIAKCQIVKVTLSNSSLAQMGKLFKLYFQFPDWLKLANHPNYIVNFQVGLNGQIVKIICLMSRLVQIGKL